MRSPLFKAPVFLCLFLHPGAISCQVDGTGGAGPEGSGDSVVQWVRETGVIYHSSPAIGDDGTIYIGTEGPIEWGNLEGNCTVYALNPDGTEKWKWVLPNDTGSSPPIGYNVTGAVVLDLEGNCYFIVGEHEVTENEHDAAVLLNTYLYSLDANGTERWHTVAMRVGDESPRYLIGSTEEPAIGPGNLVFAPGYNTLWAFDRDSGEEVWRHTFQDESWAGGMSSPTVGSDGTVYVNVTDVAFGSLHGVWAFDPDSTDNWTVSSAGDTGYAWWNSTDVAANELGNSSPALDESRGVLYVGRGADETGAGNHHYLYALSTATGALEWKFSTDPLTIYASPAVGSDGTVYAGTTSKPLSSPDQAGVFYAINPDGSELWRYDTSPDVEGARDIYTGAAVGDDGTVYFTNENRYLYALDGSTGAVVRKYDLKNLVGGTAEGAVVHSSPALGPDGTIYVGEFYYTFTQDGVPVSAGYVEENPGGDIDHTGAVYALDCSSGGLASSPWPAFRYDQQNSGSR